ncbi:MAG: metallophosphoesterase family protein [bacterium]
MKIIATADVHLGMKFSSYAANQAELAEERFRALERVVEQGNELQADVLVVAGDLFHRVRVAAAIVERAARILSAFDGSVTLVLPGNHDFLAPDGDRLWSHFREAAGDRTVVLDRAGSFDLSLYDLPVTVLAAPCDAQHGSAHRLAWARDFSRPPGHLAVGVAHGSVSGLTLDSEGHYFPMDKGLLGSLDADVWLVGHTHRPHDERDARLVVPGTPEADGFDCPVLGGAALVTLESARTGGAPATYAAEFVSTGRFRFVERSVTVHDPAGERTADELAAEVTATIPDGEPLVRLAVDGTLADESFERWNELRARLLADQRILRVDDERLERVLSRADVDRRFAAGSFAHRLLSRLVDDNDHDALAEALSIIEETRS